MNAFHSLESTLASWYSNVPNLPLSWRIWIARNAWWITLILAILSAIGAVILLISLPVLGAASYVNSIYSARAPGFYFATTVVNLIFAVVSVILLFSAVSPLKNLRKRGWNFIFLNELLGVLGALVAFVLTLSVFSVWGLLWSLIIIAVELYVLFQIRPQFVGKAANTQEAQVIEK